MKARQLIDGASYGPEALKAIGQAFDEAWQTIEGNFSNDPLSNSIPAVKLQTAAANSMLWGRRTYIGTRSIARLGWGHRCKRIGEINWSFDQLTGLGHIMCWDFNCPS